ncbi:DUF309 domain-containing protein [Prochlorococcus marinus]|uniref:DUF309 domain-containing protein n=1 Tax=Prochlorococcus marinus (strain MIT 9211) TaxID=93059 RepID=A9BAR9_PROM4|nr:DUF309 domain-containing protein [Prochlorococcus marinus]ABX08931.1 conserved hypothetical protein [Prochlorococcus marinus str. MIT 9211]
MIDINTEHIFSKDKRFDDAISLFNSQDWYSAHDLLEELWHESNGMERVTLQGILQIAVAQLHLTRGNHKGATILYGEGLGRLKRLGLPDFDLDINRLCIIVESRLRLLQSEDNPDKVSIPVIYRKSHKDSSKTDLSL